MNLYGEIHKFMWRVNAGGSEMMVDDELSPEFAGIQEKYAEYLEETQRPLFEISPYVREFSPEERRLLMSLELMLWGSIALREPTELSFVGRLRRAGHETRFNIQSRLFDRSILVFQEVGVLVSRGYQDGAVARWRTLRELSVIMKFIDKHGDASAARFHDYSLVKKNRDTNYFDAKRHAEKGFWGNFGRNVILENAAEAKASLGGFDERKGDWEWARPFLKLPKKKKVSFQDIFRDVGDVSDESRFSVAMASSANHGGARPHSQVFGSPHFGLEDEDIEVVYTPFFMPSPNHSNLPMVLAAQDFLEATDTYLSNFDPIIAGTFKALFGNNFLQAAYAYHRANKKGA